MRRRRRNPAASSKADIIESLLRLGDVDRNNQLGEARTALEKAAVLIDKYNVTWLKDRQRSLMAKLERKERGEPEPKEEKKQEQESSSYGDDWFRRWQETMRQRKEYKARQRASRRYEARERRRQRTAERKRQKAEKSRDYVKPSRYDEIIWLWSYQSISPKKGKAGERWKAYFGSKTIQEMLDRGGKWSDVKYNILKGFMSTKVV